MPRLFWKIAIVDRAVGRTPVNLVKSIAHLIIHKVPADDGLEAALIASGVDGMSANEGRVLVILDLGVAGAGHVVLDRAGLLDELVVCGGRDAENLGVGDGRVLDPNDDAFPVVAVADDAEAARALVLKHIPSVHDALYAVLAAATLVDLGLGQVTAVTGGGATGIQPSAVTWLVLTGRQREEEGQTSLQSPLVSMAGYGWQPLSM